MAAYIICYDLNKLGQRYQKLNTLLSVYPKAKPILDSTWTVITDDSAEVVYARVKPALDDNDAVFISQLTVPPARDRQAWNGFSQEINRWLNLVL